MKNKENRCSNFELLKIILIIMVLILHYFNKSSGGLFGNVYKGSFNYFVSYFIESLCIVAVNTFVLITGYFSCKKKEIKISKIIKIYAISLFYGTLILLAVLIFTDKAFSLSLLKELIKSSFSKWFIVTYSILYLLIPFINKLISSISKKELQTLLIINAIVFYLWPTFFTNTPITDNGYGITNFINLYLVGAYIRMYAKEFKTITAIIIYLTCTIITTTRSLSSDSAWAYSTIFNLIGSISLFLIFKNLKIKNNNLVNNLASYTLEIYIIHETSFIRKILYQGIFKSNLYWNSKYMIVNLIYTSIGIFLLCVIIEFLRRKILGKVFDDQIDKIDYKITCN